MSYLARIAGRVASSAPVALPAVRSESPVALRDQRLNLGAFAALAGPLGGASSPAGGTPEAFEDQAGAEPVEPADVKHARVVAREPAPTSSAPARPVAVIEGLEPAVTPSASPLVSSVASPPLSAAPTVPLAPPPVWPDASEPPWSAQPSPAPLARSDFLPAGEALAAAPLVAESPVFASAASPLAVASPSSSRFEHAAFDPAPLGPEARAPEVRVPVSASVLTPAPRGQEPPFASSPAYPEPTPSAPTVAVTEGRPASGPEALANALARIDTWMRGAPPSPPAPFLAEPVLDAAEAAPAPVISIGHIKIEVVPPAPAPIVQSAPRRSQRAPATTTLPRGFQPSMANFGLRQR